MSDDLNTVHIEQSLRNIIAWIKGGHSRSLIITDHSSGLRVTAEVAHRVVTFATDPADRAFAYVARRLQDEDGQLAREILRTRIGNLEVTVDGGERSLDKKRGELSRLRDELDHLFYERAKVLLAPFVDRLDFPRRDADNRLSISVKTLRCPADESDCEAQGSQPPVRAADDAAWKLGQEFGLVCKGWEAIEKGWGYYSYLTLGESHDARR